MLRHPYKYLVKVVHRSFFPVFALLENPDGKVGDKVVLQRKLLYLEKLFASLLLGAPKIKEQLKSRIASLEASAAEAHYGSRAILLKVIKALDVLVHFFLPAVFRLGYKVRCCTWDGRSAATGGWAREIMEQCVLLMIHLLGDKDCKNEYIRTLAVALATWQPWMDKVPAVCFVEESCEALLSRMGHRCDVHRTLHGFDSTFDLFLTLPPPRRGTKATRGMLKAGLVAVFAARIRRILFADGSNLLFAAAGGAKDMHAVFAEQFPEEFEFPKELPQAMTKEHLENVIRKGLRCLTGKNVVNDTVRDFLEDNVPLNSEETKTRITRCLDEQVNFFKKSRVRTTAAPRPPAKKRLMPKPKGVILRMCIEVNAEIMHFFYFESHMRLKLQK